MSHNLETNVNEISSYFFDRFFAFIIFRCISCQKKLGSGWVGLGRILIIRLVLKWPWTFITFFSDFLNGFRAVWFSSRRPIHIWLLIVTSYASITCNDMFTYKDTDMCRYMCIHKKNTYKHTYDAYHAVCAPYTTINDLTNCTILGLN